MAHSIILIASSCDNIIGNATTGTLHTAKVYAGYLDDAINNNTAPDPTAAHAALEAFQAWLTASGSYGGAKDESAEYAATLKDLLP